MVVQEIMGSYIKLCLYHLIYNREEMILKLKNTISVNLISAIM